MTSRRRSGSGSKTAGILAFMLLFLVLFSSVFLASEAGHHCCDSHCPVCACIRQCEKTLGQVSGGGTARAVPVLPVLFFLSILFFCRRGLLQDTLVSEKVRMND